MAIPTIANRAYDAHINYSENMGSGMKSWYLDTFFLDPSMAIIRIQLEQSYFSDYFSRRDMVKITFERAFNEFCKAVKASPSKELRDEFMVLFTGAMNEALYINNPVKKPEPQIDPEIKSASFIAEEAMKIGREAKEKIEYVEKLKNDHAKKYGTFLEKCRAYIK